MTGTELLLEKCLLNKYFFFLAREHQMVFHVCFRHVTNRFTLGVVSDDVGIEGDHVRARSVVPSSSRPYGW